MAVEPDIDPSIPRITVRPGTDDFVRVAENATGGFSRLDAGTPTGDANGFARVLAPQPVAAPAATPPAGQPLQADSGGFERVLASMEQQQPLAAPQTSSWFDKMLEPFTSYPATEANMAADARDQMGKGVKQIMGEPPGERLYGAGNLAMGALQYPLAPISAALRTVVGKPLEENTGIPKEYSEFAAGLALPGIGFGKAPKTLQKIFSPETVSPEAMEAAALIRQRTGIAARDTENTAATLESWQKPVNQLTPEQQLGIMHYIEGARPPAAPPADAMAKQNATQFLRDLGHTPKDDPAYFLDPIKWATAAGWDASPSLAKNARTRSELEMMGANPKDFVYQRPNPANANTSGGARPAANAPDLSALSTPGMRALADTLKNAFELRKQKLQALPQQAQRDFIEDYFPHFWTDPALAANVVQRGGFMKQGSGASLKGRTIPTIQEGLNQGLTPLTTNPIEATMRYVTSMDKFVAQQEMINKGVADGTIIYRRPSAMGASGNPNSVQNIPPGYVALEGRASAGAGGAAFAPEDWARIYNNFISRGFDQIGGGEYGAAYNMLRRGSNAITQMLLSFSGYHAFTMAEAGMSSQMAKVASDLRHGQGVEAIKDLGKYATSPVRYASEGSRLRDVYLGKIAAQSPQEKEIVDLITQAGGRMSKHSLLDYESSALGDYLTAFRRGRLRIELAEQGKDILTNPVSGTLRTVASNVGRTMDTFNKPLFQHYIPAMKNAALKENLSQWMGQNPAATQAEKLAAARQIVDSVDNRFGEMIHDNIFWNKVAKQSAMLGMLSYSWNMGGWREVGGGVRDMARTAVGQGQWTPKADYVVGMALNWAIMSAAYQYMKTGEAPKDVHDLVAPRTGGVDARSGEPERIIPPGIMKDVFGYWEHFGQEVGNKLNPGLKLLSQTATNSDWRGDPILSPRSPGQTAISKAPDWLADYFRFIIKTASPIQAQNVLRGKEEGSNLNSFEQALGIRKAPRQFIDAEGYDQMMNSLAQRRWQAKKRHDATEQRRYGGTE